jgi:hypothetical protein
VSRASSARHGPRAATVPSPPLLHSDWGGGCALLDVTGRVCLPTELHPTQPVSEPLLHQSPSLPGGAGEGVFLAHRPRLRSQACGAGVPQTATEGRLLLPHPLRAPVLTVSACHCPHTWGMASPGWFAARRLWGLVQDPCVTQCFLDSCQGAQALSRREREQMPRGPQE